MASLEDPLFIAVRHVVRGRRIVEEQRKRIGESKVDKAVALGLLDTFECSLAIFEKDLIRLLKYPASTSAR